MTFERYTHCDSFMSDVMDILREHESQNIHTIGTLTFESTELRRNVMEKLIDANVDDDGEIVAKFDEMMWNNPEGLLATVKDSTGNVLLTAHCSFPYDKLTLLQRKTK